MGSSSSHVWGYAAAVFHEGNRGMARVHTGPQGHVRVPNRGIARVNRGIKKFRKEVLKKEVQ